MAFVVSSKWYRTALEFKNVLAETGLEPEEALQILRDHVDGTPPLPMDLWGADIHTAAGLLEEY